MSRRGLVIASFAVAGSLFGAAEAATVPAQAARPVVLLFGAGASIMPALLMGLLAAGALTLFPRLPGSARLSAWFERVNSSDPEADRAPVIGLIATLLSVLIVFRVSAVLSPLLYGVLFSLQERQLAVELAALVATLQVLGALAAIPPLARLLRRPLRQIDRRWPMPQPRPLWARWLLFVVLPVFALLYPFLLRHGSMLSWLRDGLILVLLSCLGVLAALLLGSLPERVGRKLPLPLIVIALVGLGAVGLRAAALPRTTAATERSMLPGMGLRMARALTDVDRDGSSSLFGGGDCAAFDARRAPGMAEAYDNGVDEDCDGRDNPVPKNVATGFARFSDALPPAQVKPYNVVWVIMETVRADHVSAYGYPKPTMPYFEELAKESLLFERAYAQASATLLSMPSMMTGVNPGAMTWTTNQLQPQAESAELLIAERLKLKGYKTAAVLENYTKRNFPGMQQGLDKVMVGEPDRSGRYNRPRRALHANAKAFEWLAHIKPKERFFLWHYYVDPHGPYTRHPDIDNSKFTRDKPGNYDSELAWTDQALRAFVETLRARRQLWDRTILIITADHGEEFYDHGTHSHATSCHRESVHVPLLVRIPGIKPQRVETPVALVDIVPTVLEATGFRDNLDQLSGQSLLAPVLAPGKVSKSRPLFCSIASITDKYGTFFRRALRQDNYALFTYNTKNQVALYDMQADPKELQDLSKEPQHQARVQSMKALLSASLTGNLREHTRMRKHPKKGR